MEKLTEHFSREEFACKDGCGFDDVSMLLVDRLESARSYSCVKAGRDIKYVITSGCRCSDYNLAVGGSPDSAHLYGEAADIEVSNSRNRFYIIYGLIMAGFTRIGIGKDFIHVDVSVSASKPYDVCWTYYKSN